MESQFYTNEGVCMERELDLEVANMFDRELTWTEEEVQSYINSCLEFITQNGYKRVCLQFPDNLIKYSAEFVLTMIERTIGKVAFFIMSDTTYENCCVDYSTAAHVLADSIIHFGEKCLSECSGELPCFYIARKEAKNQFTAEKLVSLINKQLLHEDDENAKTNQVLIMLDLPYLHLKEELLSKKCYTVWTILNYKETNQKISPDIKFVVFLTNSEKKMIHFYFHQNLDVLYYYDTRINEEELQMYRPSMKIMSRRNFLIEKVKDANTIGILVGSLALRHYIKCIERLKILFKLAAKKYYVIHVGRPTVAKLANFPEIEVYVVVACPMSEIFDNSKDFYQPLVTPYDVEMALNQTQKNKTSLNLIFNPTCSAFIDKEIKIKNSNNKNKKQNGDDRGEQEGEEQDEEEEEDEENMPDVSLITGRIRYKERESNEKEDNDKEKEEKTETEVSCRNSAGELIQMNSGSHFGAGFLQTRTFQGLEQKLGQTKVELAKEGTKGIAQNYTHEKDK